MNHLCCLCAGTVEGQLQHFATILLHHASVKVTSVLEQFIIFRGVFLFNILVGLCKFSLVDLVVYLVVSHSALLCRE